MREARLIENAFRLFGHRIQRCGDLPLPCRPVREGDTAIMASAFAGHSVVTFH